MPIQFPTNPTQGQVYTYAGNSWIWDGEGWEPGVAIGATGATGPAGTSSNIGVWDEGNLVTTSVSGIKFIGAGITANLVASNVEVTVTATGTGAGGFTYANTAPSTPVVGDRWVDTNTMIELVYVYDGTSYQWVQLTSQAPSGANRELSNLTTTSISANLVPASNITYDLGSSSQRWRDLYLSGNTMYLGAATLSATGSSIQLPAGSTVGGAAVATTTDVSTGGGPKVTNIQIATAAWTVLDDTAVDTAGGYVIITGSNFVSGCLVYFNQTPATSVGYVSATTLRITVPALAAGTYVVYVINPDGGTAIRVPGLTASATPSWTTGSSLPEQYDNVAITLSLVAISAVSYTLSAGSLPPGLSLNANTGVITGTVTGITVDTSYTFTVTATDAELQDSPRTFTVTITVSDPYFKLTTLLLSGSAISANTVVRDSSTNNFNLTVYGDARASNFTPYGTGWSVYFDGTGDLLSGTITGGVGSGDFTLEYWVYHNTLTDWQTHFATTRGVTGFNVGTDATGDLVFYDNVGGTGGRRIEVIGAITVNRWYHFAFSRSGTSLRGFLDGTLRGTYTTSQDYSATAFYIGALDTTQEYTNGYISNLRLVKGSALYTANFTPATTNLTTVANTSLLTCNVNRFRDSSVNNFAITRNGDARVVSFNPFNITNTGVDGSMYFDGTDDYVATPSNAAFGFSGTWTIECWFYVATTSGCRLWQTSNEVDNCEVNSPSVGYVNYYNGAASVNSGAAVVIPFSWTHLAAVCTANSTKVYVNGVLAITHSTSNTTARSIGIGGSSNLDFLGYISNFRVVNGTALYSSNFTPPAQPLTAIANTQLLTLQYDQPHNNHTFLDSSSNQFVITRSGNASQGIFSPFSQSGWSVYINNGTSSQIRISDNAALRIGTSAFTIESWVYPTGFSEPFYVLRKRVNGNLGAGTWAFTVATNGSVLLEQVQGPATIAQTSAGLVALNTWTHVAVSRDSSNNVKIFVNGTIQATATSSYNFNDASNPISLLCDYDGRNASSIGYASNLRFVIGSAVYTANFTPATSNLTSSSQGALAADVKILTFQDNRFRDASTNNFTITISGSPSLQAFSPFAPTAVYNPAVHGGSAYFDGTGDYLSSSINAISTNDFTIQYWSYLTSHSGTNGEGGYFQISATSGGLEQGYTNGIMATRAPGGTLVVNITNTSISTNYALPLNQWFYTVITRLSNTVRVYVNNLSVATPTTVSTNLSGTFCAIGGYYNTNYLMTGYLANFRVLVGTGYNDGTLPALPIAPLGSNTETRLLLNFTDTAILDSTGRTVIETVGDARTSAFITKFTGGSMYFDGSGDYLAIPASELFTLRTADFTVECWVYFINFNNQQIVGTLSTNSTTSWAFYVQGSTLIFSNWNVTAASYATSNLATFNWYHIATTRQSGTFRLFVNGTVVNSNTPAAQDYSSTQTLYIGDDVAHTGTGAFTGYINDLRITRGYARYIANFTAPTVAARLK